jgi:hypothetical protein
VVREIPLSQGYVALVDEDDYEWLSQWCWYYSRGYAVRSRYFPETQKCNTVRMHRLILSAPKGVEVDHINTNTWDNRRANLRLVDRVKNVWNQSPTRGGTSKYKGVYWNKDRKKWHVQMVCLGERIHVGFFKDEIEAALAYDEKAVQYFGEFAWLNFPNRGSKRGAQTCGQSVSG